jgi:L-threonylcarbamoyladenylate synthase
LDFVVSWQNEFRIRHAARLVASGGVIAYPTEAVWGLGCSPFDKAAVDRVLHLKNRPVGKGLILIAGTIEQFEPFLTKINRQQRKKLESTWPGPSTWLVPNTDLVPSWISGNFSSVALRVSDHPTVQMLCHYTGPLVSTSANAAGRSPLRSLLEVQIHFGQSIDAIVPGKIGRLSKPTEIRDLLTGRIIRA